MPTKVCLNFREPGEVALVDRHAEKCRLVFVRQ
jgi:hypothetical protein